MNALADRRRPQADDEFTLDELIPRFQALAQGFARVTAAVHQLARLQQQRELDPRDPRRKRRLPSVCKTMTSPTEADDFLKRAVAAYRQGDEALRQFAFAERAAGRLEF